MTRSVSVLLIQSHMLPVVAGAPLAPYSCRGCNVCVASVDGHMDSPWIIYMPHVSALEGVRAGVWQVVGGAVRRLCTCTTPSSSEELKMELTPEMLHPQIL